MPFVVDPFCELRERAADCTRCDLAATRTQVVFGTGHADAPLVVVGEAPGEQEDRTGEPFVGRSGTLLRRVIAEETDLAEDDCCILNVIKCRPPDNRDPRPAEIEACRPWLDEQLAVVAPVVVLSVGNFASRLLLGTTEGITRLRGRSYPWRSVHLVPTLHPAAVLRGGQTAMEHFRHDVHLAGVLANGAAA
ncbi:MAG: uracil-DNA glycosylase [Actinobacteria bacterium]|nr:uracil-DNA glycosylase [Actinomycetota bacterium]